MQNIVLNSSAVLICREYNKLLLATLSVLIHDQQQTEKHYNGTEEGREKIACFFSVSTVMNVSRKRVETCNKWFVCLP